MPRNRASSLHFSRPEHACFTTSAGNHAGWTPASAPYPTYWIEQNNYAPVSYPYGIGNVPSPGGASGEKVDLEALYWRLNGDLAQPSLQVLLATSVDDHAYFRSWQRHYRLGDLFLDMDGDGVYDFVSVTTDWDGGGIQPWRAYDPATGTYRSLDHDAAPGSLYQISHPAEAVVTPDSQVATIIGPGGGYGDYPDIESVVRPWVVDQDPGKVGAAIGLAGLAKQSYSYGPSWGGGYYGDYPNQPNGTLFSEDNTWFYEWTIPLYWIDPDGSLTAENVQHIGLHLALECGNDLIAHEGTPIVRPQDGPFVPEPASSAAVALSIIGISCYARRRRKAL